MVDVDGVRGARGIADAPSSLLLDFKIINLQHKRKIKDMTCDAESAQLLLTWSKLTTGGMMSQAMTAAT